jgi:hypothetical protein
VGIVNRFKGYMVAPSQIHCDLHGNNPIQGVNLSIDALDLTVTVDAFKGFAYPFAGPTAPLACPP